MTTRKSALKSDPRGDFRPYIGVRSDGRQQRFNLGRDLAEAERRRDRLQRLYAESAQARRGYGLPPSWTEAALAAARAVERGQAQVPLPPPAAVNEAVGPGREIGGYDPCWDPLAPHALLWCHGVASRLYPSVNWVLPEGTAGRSALDFGQRVFDMHARRQARLLDAEAPAAPVAGTLHQALDRYDRHLVEVVSSHVPGRSRRFRTNSASPPLD